MVKRRREEPLGTGGGSGYVPYVHSLWGFSKPDKREKKKKKKKCSID
jgi:hypothetical protein